MSVSHTFPPTTPPRPSSSPKTTNSWISRRDDHHFKPGQDDDDDDNHDNDHFPIPLTSSTTTAADRAEITEPPTSFSPSKARAQARQTHQLNLLKSWLLSLSSTAAEISHQQNLNPNINLLIRKWETEYVGLTVSNPTLAGQVLGVFQDLMYANRSGDQRRRLIHEAQLEELEELSTVSSSSSSSSATATAVTAQNLIQKMHENLSSSTNQHLRSLAESAVLLGCLLPPMESGLGSNNINNKTLVSEIGEALMQSTVNSQTLEDHLAALSRLRNELHENVDQNEIRLRDATQTRRQEDVDGEGMQVQTAQWNRETKQVSMKIQEYKDRIATLERTRPGRGGGQGMTTIEDIIDLQDRVKSRQDTVKALEDRVKAFHGLPADLEASRQEVRRARAELEQWKIKREGLFANMTG